MGSRRRQRDTPRRAERPAQALVELAIILPVTLVMVLGMIDLGRAYVFGVAVQNGAREAARLGARAALDTTVQNGALLQRAVLASSPALSGCSAPATTSTSATYSCTDAAGSTWTATVAPSLSTTRTSGTQLRVTISGQVSLLTGFMTGWMGLGLNQVAVQGDAAMVVF